jgi:hypothetical protein
MQKYEKPVWQIVYDAARELKVKTFAPIDLIRKVHKKNIQVPTVTIQTYVIAMAPNHPSSYHYPTTRRLHGYFTYLGNGRFKLKDKTEPQEKISGEDEVEGDYEDARICLEGDLETFIFEKIDSLEDGLTLYKGKSGRQYSSQSGIIDILAKDKDDYFVVIELKVGTAGDAVLTRTLSYMADITKDLAGPTRVRGIIIAQNFSKRLILAVSLLQNVELMECKVRFEFEKVH